VKRVEVRDIVKQVGADHRTAAAAAKPDMAQAGGKEQAKLPTRAPRDKLRRDVLARVIVLDEPEA